MKPNVSIIIPHFNRSHLLKQTIDSVNQQTYKNWELIIVDDGSDDAELEKIREYANAKNIKVLQRSGGIKGPSSCRNQGVKISSGEYLLFLDSDDLLAPFCIEQRIAAMTSSKQTNMGIFVMENFKDYPGDTRTNFNINTSLENSVSLFLQNNNPWNVTCPIWKKDFFEKVGGFDEELLFMEDPELHLRAINYPGAEIKTFYDHPADCYYRINHIDDTKKGFYYNSIFYRILFYKKILEKYNNDFITNNTHYIKKGIYALIKTFLYSRKNQFPGLYNDLKKLMKESTLFSLYEIRKISFLVDLGNTESGFLKKMKVRGICYQLLPCN
ncbi:MAG: glycosyltransferase family A protein [Ginsengibacter sp.]